MAKRYRSHETGARRSPVELRLVRVVFEQDPDADEKYLKGLGERLASYKDGVFDFMLVRAVAEVRIEGIDQVLTSAGAYGVESDSEDAHLEEVATEQWRALRKVLTTVGVPTSELPLEVDQTWVEWRM